MTVRITLRRHPARTVVYHDVLAVRTDREWLVLTLAGTGATIRILGSGVEVAAPDHDFAGATP